MQMKRYQDTLRFAIVVHDHGAIGPKDAVLWDLHQRPHASIETLLQQAQVQVSGWGGPRAHSMPCHAMLTAIEVCHTRRAWTVSLQRHQWRFGTALLLTSASQEPASDSARDPRARLRGPEKEQQVTTVSAARRRAQHACEPCPGILAPSLHLHVYARCWLQVSKRCCSCGV